MESTLIPASAPLNQGQELGGEFPIEELHTGEGGLLKVMKIKSWSYFIFLKLNLKSFCTQF